MTKMRTKGRHRDVMDRARRLNDVIAENQGQKPAFYKNVMGCTPGRWQSAIRYLLEDGMVRHTGIRKGAKYYLTDVGQRLYDARMKSTVIAASGEVHNTPLQSDEVAVFDDPVIESNGNVYTFTLKVPQQTNALKQIVKQFLSSNATVNDLKKAIGDD